VKTWQERRAELQALRDQFAAMDPAAVVHQRYGDGSTVPTSAGAMVEDLDDAIALGPLLYDEVMRLHEQFEREAGLT
jgi:hypothetical protein